MDKISYYRILIERLTYKINGAFRENNDNHDTLNHATTTKFVLRSAHAQIGHSEHSIATHCMYTCPDIHTTVTEACIILATLIENYYGSYFMNVTLVF